MCKKILQEEEFKENIRKHRNIEASILNQQEEEQEN
jgi:hypothetical protein